jgi:hypothetical protein
MKSQCELTKAPVCAPASVAARRAGPAQLGTGIQVIVTVHPVEVSLLEAGPAQLGTGIQVIVTVHPVEVSLLEAGPISSIPSV